MPLNRKQARFVREYMKDHNASQAYIRAGYKAKDADVAGPRLLGNVGIKAEIDKLIHERNKRLEISGDNVLRELARVGFAKMDRFSKWGPNGVRLRRSSALTEDDVAAIQEVSETITKEGGSRKIKLHSKPAALRELAKHLGLYKDRQPIDVLLSLAPPELAGPLREAYSRLLAERGAAETGGASP